MEAHLNTEAQAVFECNEGASGPQATRKINMDRGKKLAIGFFIMAAFTGAAMLGYFVVGPLGQYQTVDSGSQTQKIMDKVGQKFMAAPTAVRLNRVNKHAPTMAVEEKTDSVFKPLFDDGFARDGDHLDKFDAGNPDGNFQKLRRQQAEGSKNAREQFSQWSKNNLRPPVRKDKLYDEKYDPWREGSNFDKIRKSLPQNLQQRFTDVSEEYWEKYDWTRDNSAWDRFLSNIARNFYLPDWESNFWKKYGPSIRVRTQDRPKNMGVASGQAYDPGQPGSIKTYGPGTEDKLRQVVKAIASKEFLDLGYDWNEEGSKYDKFWDAASPPSWESVQKDYKERPKTAPDNAYWDKYDWSRPDSHFQRFVGNERTWRKNENFWARYAPWREGSNFAKLFGTETKDKYPLAGSSYWKDYDWTQDDNKLETTLKGMFNALEQNRDNKLPYWTDYDSTRPRNKHQRLMQGLFGPGGDGKAWSNPPVPRATTQILEESEPWQPFAVATHGAVNQVVDPEASGREFFAEKAA